MSSAMLTPTSLVDRGFAGELDDRRWNLSDDKVHSRQETRFEAQGQLQEEDYTFFWVGKTAEPGVAFAVHNTIAKKLTSLPTAISPRLMSMRVPIEKGRYLTLVNVYAPR